MIATAQKEELDGFCSVNEASRFLSVSLPTLYAMLHRNELPHIKVGSRYRIARRGLAAMLEQAEKGARR